MSFEVDPTEIPAVVRIRSTRHEDARGSFQETYRRSAFVQAGLGDRLVQHNLAVSSRGVLRGLHYQLPPAAQGKLVHVVQGRVYDVAVDLRRGSPTFGDWVGMVLKASEGTLLWVPAGFAHGYCVLSEEARVSYGVTAEYAPDLERGVRWDDPAIGVRWPVDDPVLSEKDAALPLLAEAEIPFRHGEGEEA